MQASTACPAPAAGSWREASIGVPGLGCLTRTTRFITRAPGRPANPQHHPPTPPADAGSLPCPLLLPGDPLAQRMSGPRAVMHDPG